MSRPDDLSALLEAVPAGALVVTGGRVCYATAAAAASLGAKDAAALEGRPPPFPLDAKKAEVRRPGEDGERILEARMQPIEWDGAPATAVVLQDVTESRRLADEIATRRGRHRQMFEQNTAIKLIIDPDDTRILQANPAAAAFYGYDLETLEQMSLAEINLLPKERVLEQMVAARREERAYFLFRHRLASGEVRDVEVYSGPVDIDGKQRLFSIIHDITDRVRAEARLTQAVETQRTLLREVHHRVKNNLQVVSSLLSLQRDRVHDAEARRIFDESQVRIRAMALLHELLHWGEGEMRLDFDAYLSRLVGHLYRVYGVDPDRIVPEIDAGGVSLDLDVANPCGLLVTELVSNSLKHAFPGERSGHIEVRLTPVDDGFDVVVADDGVGLPASIDPSGAGTVGLMLVGALTEQLGGMMEIAREPGTRFTIRCRGR